MHVTGARTCSKGRANNCPKRIAHCYISAVHKRCRAGLQRLHEATSLHRHPDWDRLRWWSMVAEMAAPLVGDAPTQTKRNVGGAQLGTMHRCCSRSGERSIKQRCSHKPGKCLLWCRNIMTNQVLAGTHSMSRTHSPTSTTAAASTPKTPKRIHVASQWPASRSRTSTLRLNLHRPVERPTKRGIPRSQTIGSPRLSTKPKPPRQPHA